MDDIDTSKNRLCFSPLDPYDQILFRTSIHHDIARWFLRTGQNVKGNLNAQSSAAYEPQCIGCLEGLSFGTLYSLRERRRHDGIQGSGVDEPLDIIEGIVNKQKASAFTGNGVHILFPVWPFPCRRCISGQREQDG